MNQEILSGLKEFILEQNNTQTDKLIDYIDSRFKEVEKIIQTQAEKNEQLEEELKQIKARNQILERQLRKNGIIIYNLNYKDGDLLTFTTSKLNVALKLPVQLSEQDISNIYTVGRSHENKPIIVQFVRYLTKQNILKHCKNLRGSNISISENLTAEEREDRKVLARHLKEAKGKNLKAHIYRNKLYIENREYTANELRKSGEVLEEKKTDNLVGDNVFNAESDSENNQEEEKGPKKKRKIIRSTRLQKPILK